MSKKCQKSCSGGNGSELRAVKDAATTITKPLAYIISISLQSGSVPMEWKAAKIIPLFKSGSMVELDNYRPISMLPVLSKILERIVYKQLLSHLENNGLLSSFQFGFRSRSTELAVTYFTDIIRKEVDSGNILGAAFIDLSKAFDTVSLSCRPIEVEYFWKLSAHKSLVCQMIAGSKLFFPVIHIKYVVFMSL